MSSRKSIEKLQVSQYLYDFIQDDVLAELQIDSCSFWSKFSTIIEELMPLNQQLLDKRQTFQHQIDQWHVSHQKQHFNISQYKQFLTDIGYIAPEIPDFTITTTNVDHELSSMAGPQLVVPIMNARFAINAVNARWGSLYDALYGTDCISEQAGAENTQSYNPVRGQKVIEFGREFLDEHLPLCTGNHSQAINYSIINQQVVVTLCDKQQTTLQQPSKFRGFQGTKASPTTLLFKNNGLHFEVNFNKNSAISKTDLANISDITLEAALTTIMDCEDSIAAVDAEDKVTAYKNWLGLNKGQLTEQIHKNGTTFLREMAADRQYQSPTEQSITLKGRSLMFVRNVGHLMTTDAILTSNGEEIPEGIMDAMITSLIALFDINNKTALSNSKEKSIYIVKPKMHGPEEVAFTNLLFERVETALELPKNTIKMGIMDEERRTSINLKACINAAKERVVFINTGFLDRTGDEIHTSMGAGPMKKKNEMKQTSWIKAYEQNNVNIGLACGFSGKAQIGKGMWPIPEQMANMLHTKIDHVLAGANTAWVPSPTAATLHTLHYHKVNVFNLQKKLVKHSPVNIDDILTIPLADDTDWSTTEIERELDNNSQGILGYVVRWIDQGIGCSKVPDISNVELMEDRATLRISSQHLANWLKHKVCNRSQIMASLKKMAKIVDEQNKLDPNYQAMSSNFDTNIAFTSACDLIFKGEVQPSGYTEPLLHHYRKLKKQEG